jgi:hypothetical protein
MQAAGGGSKLLMLLRVLALSVPLLALFAASATLAALAVAWVRGRPLLGPENVCLGVICGLVVWLFLAVFHVRNEIVVLHVPDQDALVTSLCTLLEEAGYGPVVRGDGQLTFRPTFTSLLFGGGIQVRVQDTEVRVSGPKHRLEMLRNHVRMAMQVEKVQKSFSDSRFRQGTTLLKRVEISLRVSAEQWPAVRQRVLDTLAREGADVCCDVNILAQSEKGIPESTFDLLIGDWIRRQDIPAELHKEAIATPPAADASRPRSGAENEPALAGAPAQGGIEN